MSDDNVDLNFIAAQLGKVLDGQREMRGEIGEMRGQIAELQVAVATVSVATQTPGPPCQD